MSWDTLHHHYKNQDWSKIPSLFAEQVTQYFPKDGKILELWAWLGQDSRYFHSLGYSIDSTDISQKAVDINTTGSEREIDHGWYNTFVLDVTKDLEIMDNNKYDIIYAHLSLHYFSYEDTKKILAHLARILKKGWICAVLLNTVHDPEYGQGYKIEDDFFEIPWQNTKRYFSINSATHLFGLFFQTIVCDDTWETYKDSAKWIHNLIRFIWHN
jgi:SAM-dependent methyltransferase